MKTIERIASESVLATIPHANNKTLAQHCISVADLLSQFGANSHVTNAGYFHSAYGREFTKFVAFDFSQRNWLKNVIGAEAEHICYLNCIMSAASFWANFHYGRSKQGTPFLINRLNNEKIQINREDLLALLLLNFANMMDHIDPTKGIKSFKWHDLSLYVQYKDFLPAEAVKVFKDTFLTG